MINTNCDCLYIQSCDTFDDDSDDSGVLHSPVGWKLERVASLHVDNDNYKPEVLP